MNEVEHIRQALCEISYMQGMVSVLKPEWENGPAAQEQKEKLIKAFKALEKLEGAMESGGVP